MNVENNAIDKNRIIKEMYMHLDVVKSLSKLYRIQYYDKNNDNINLIHDIEEMSELGIELINYVDSKLNNNNIDIELLKTYIRSEIKDVDISLINIRQIIEED